MCLYGHHLEMDGQDHHAETGEMICFTLSYHVHENTHTHTHTHKQTPCMRTDGNTQRDALVEKEKHACSAHKVKDALQTPHVSWFMHGHKHVTLIYARVMRQPPSWADQGSQAEGDVEIHTHTHTHTHTESLSNDASGAEQMKPPASQPASPSSVTFLFCSRDAALLLFLRFSFSSSIAFTSTSPRFFFNWEAAWAMIGNRKNCWSTTHYTRVPHLKSQRSSGAV